MLPRFRRDVVLLAHDVRDEPPGGPFDLVLCRYMALTYFDEAGRRDTVRRLAAVTRRGGALVIGTHEQLPDGGPGFVGWARRLGVFRRADDG